MPHSNRSPQFRGPDHKLANPLSVLHDHPYGQFQQRGDKAWKSVPGKVVLGWSTAPLPLTPEHAVSKRHSYLWSSDAHKTRSAIVETEGESSQIRVDWPYSHREERSAKFLAKLKMKDGQMSQTHVQASVAKRKRPVTSDAPKGSKKAKPVKRLAGGAAKVNSSESRRTAQPKAMYDLSKYISLNGYRLQPSSSTAHVAQNQNHSLSIKVSRQSSLSSHDHSLFSLTAGASSTVDGNRSSSSRSKDLNLPVTYQMKAFSIPLRKIPLSVSTTSPPAPSQVQPA